MLSVREWPAATAALLAAGEGEIVVEGAPGNVGGGRGTTELRTGERYVGVEPPEPNPAATPVTETGGDAIRTVLCWRL